MANAAAAFDHLARLSDPAITRALLAQIDAREQGPGEHLLRANLLRRMGDLDGARSSFAQYLGRALPEWSAIPPGIVHAGFAIAPVLQIKDFLPPARMAALHRYACEHEPDYVDRVSEASLVGEGRQGRTLVFRDAGPERAHLLGFLTDNLAAIRDCLGMPEFAVSHTEIKLTNNLDGGFLAAHSDHQGDTAEEGRAITCLYYFGSPESAPVGGDLLLFDSLPREGRYSQYWSTRIAPRPNLLIAFPSWFSHAVCPATGGGGRFASGRMAVSCQVRKAAGALDLWWDRTG